MKKRKYTSETEEALYKQQINQSLIALKEDVGEVNSKLIGIDHKLNDYYPTRKEVDDRFNLFEERYGLVRKNIINVVVLIVTLFISGLFFLLTRTNGQS